MMVAISMEGLALALLVPGIATDDVDLPFATNNLTIFADAFNASAHFHSGGLKLQ